MARGAAKTAIGLMSGTSMDGIDAALIETDGETVERFGPALHRPYDDSFRVRLRALLGHRPGDMPEGANVVRELTERHAEAVLGLLADNGLSAADIDVVGFHGHTVRHRPEAGETVQIGDGDLLARTVKIPTVTDFRAADMAAGGQGAPLASLYHAALAHDLEKPLAVLNVGGVANVTWIGADGALLAFDTGPGNALIDDWTLETTGQFMDAGGRLARAGKPDEPVLAALMKNPYFDRAPPKSLDRLDFSVDPLGGMAPRDGAATLTAFTARAVQRAAGFFPEVPRRWLVCGGGRHNETMMAYFKPLLGVPVEAVEAVGWAGDMLEAQAFAFLAVRSSRGLPLTLPTTTGTARPTTGGVRHEPE